MSDHVRNPEDRFSHNKAHIKPDLLTGLTECSLTCNILFVSLVIFHFGFQDRILVMIVPVPGCCLLLKYKVGFEV